MFLITFIIICIFLYYLGTKNHNYWIIRGVKHDKPIAFFGNNIREFFHIKSVTEMMVELYWKYPKEKMVGYFIASVPALCIRDPVLIKHILVTDFAHFYRRGLNPHKIVEPMLKNLFFADGDLWKLLRQRMTPAFTTGKLKAMFPLIVERAERLQKIAAEAESKAKEVDIRDLMARYTTDFIGACGFGIDTDSLNDEQSTFRKLGKRIFTITKMDGLRSMLKRVFPEACKNFHFLHPEIEHITLHLVQSIMRQRNYKPSGRNDFIDLLMELKEKGKIVGESVENRNPDGSPKIKELEFDDLLMAAQVFVFFAAGFETSSSATSFTLNQLAFHPEIQKKCQDEVDSVLQKYENKLCYEAVNEMKYLEMTFREGMRMFPSLGFLVRKCAKKYTIPETDITIDEGVRVFIPIQAMQNDDKYFDNPDLFSPERFAHDQIKDLKKHVYMPFGEGPRACIGERLGLMQSLAGLAALMQKFSVEPSKNTRRHPIVDPSFSVVQSIKGGIPLALVSRKKKL